MRATPARWWSMPPMPSPWAFTLPAAETHPASARAWPIPATDVLNELSAQVGGGTSYTFVGAADHAVSCLNYGDNTVTAAQARALTDRRSRAPSRLSVRPACWSIPQQEFSA